MHAACRAGATLLTGTCYWTPINGGQLLALDGDGRARYALRQALSGSSLLLQRARRRLRKEARQGDDMKAEFLTGPPRESSRDLPLEDGSISQMLFGRSGVHQLFDAAHREGLASAQFQIASHALTSGPATSIGGDVMRSSVIALEKKRPFHPTSRTPKPAMPSIQSAIVVGEPTGDEIYLDDKDYCRVKVRFHWDPDPDTTGKNSCWVRVSQNWAGSGFGVQFHPRLGQEVLVGFLKGDPDRPIIVGGVYNDENRPPYTTPTQSGIKTDSTIDEDLANYNEIRFADKAGSEELFVQAQKTHTVNVKGSQSISVAGSRSLSVGGNDSTTVGKNRKVTVTGSETIEVTDFRKITVHQDVEENYFKKHTILVGEAQAMQAKTQEFNAEGGIQIIESPETKQTLKDGVVSVLGATKVEQKVGESSIVIERTSVTITSAGVVTVTGAQIKLNS